MNTDAGTGRSWFRPAFLAAFLLASLGASFVVVRHAPEPIVCWLLETEFRSLAEKWRTRTLSQLENSTRTFENQILTDTDIQLLSMIPKVSDYYRFTFIDTEGNTSTSGVTESGVHQLIRKYHGFLQTLLPITEVNNAGDRLFVHDLVNRIETHSLRKNLRQQGTTHGRLNDAAIELKLTIITVKVLFYANADIRLQVQRLTLISSMNLGNIRKHHSVTQRIHTLAGHKVQTQYDVLRGNDNWFAVGWRKNVV